MIRVKFLFHLFLLLNCFSIFCQNEDFRTANLSKADKIAVELKGKDLYNLPQLSNDLTKNLSSDFEKFRAIYVWVCINIQNDYHLYKKNKIKREKYKNDIAKLFSLNEEITNETFKKLIKEKKTICTGYAYLIKELSNLSNIKCEIVNGYGRTVDSNFSSSSSPNHSWNAVELNSKWYLCDATWSSGLYDLDLNKFEPKYNDGYFLQNPYFFLLNHYPLDKKWMLVNNEIIFDDFISFPLVYQDAFIYNLMIISPSKFNLDILIGQEISFKMKENKLINLDLIKVEIVSGNYKSIIKPKIDRLPDNILELKFKIEERGKFDLHFKINEDYLYTYIVTVKNKK